MVSVIIYHLFFNGFTLKLLGLIVPMFKDLIRDKRKEIRPTWSLTLKAKSCLVWSHQGTQIRTNDKGFVAALCFETGQLCNVPEPYF